MPLCRIEKSNFKGLKCFACDVSCWLCLVSSHTDPHRSGHGTVWCCGCFGAPPPAGEAEPGPQGAQVSPRYREGFVLHWCFGHWRSGESREGSELGDAEHCDRTRAMALS